MSYGYTSHVMDFPGTVTIHHETFIRYVVDILKSLAYQGFKKIIMVNGHGSNINPLELAARRAMLESDAWVGIGGWWHFMAADPDFMSTWRESDFPGGCAHAGEAETSLALFFDPDMVYMDRAKDQVTETNQRKSKYHWVDLWASGPVRMDGWTSTYTTDGTQGTPSLATADKGRRIFEESVNNIVEYAEEFATREMCPRVDHHVHAADVRLARIAGGSGISRATFLEVASRLRETFASICSNGVWRSRVSPWSSPTWPAVCRGHCRARGACACRR